MSRRWHWFDWAGLALVLGLHAAAFYGLWRYRLISLPEENLRVFVQFVSTAPQPPPQPDPPLWPPPAAPPAPEVRLQPAPPRERAVQPPMPSPSPAPRPLAVEAPVFSPAEPIAPAPPPPSSIEPPPAPPVEAPAAPAAPAEPPAARSIEAAPTAPESPPGPATPRPAAPAVLSGELALACPQHAEPVYPAAAKRRGQGGRVLLSVELDERGVVTQASVLRSSGVPALDAAAIAAVKTWRCEPPRRDGQAVRAIARQPFEFILD